MKAWTENPNGQIDGYSGNDTTEAEGPVCDPLSGTYTIGGSSPDFIDLASAVTPLHNCGISGPVVFNIGYSFPKRGIQRPGRSQNLP